MLVQVVLSLHVIYSHKDGSLPRESHLKRLWHKQSKRNRDHHLFIIKQTIILLSSFYAFIHTLLYLRYIYTLIPKWYVIYSRVCIREAGTHWLLVHAIYIFWDKTGEIKNSLSRQWARELRMIIIKDWFFRYRNNIN